MKVSTLCILILIAASAANADENRPLKLEGSLIVSAFQQQVKTEVGGESGDPLLTEFQIGLMAQGTWQIADFLTGGLYLRYDQGERSAARFDSFDDDNAARTTSRVGGSYSELWIGPILQFHWRQLRVALGYGALGIRADNGRSDLPSAAGDSEASFRTSPAVAWLLALGGAIPLDDNLDLVLKLEYRVRYYDERGGDPLFDTIEHGTQSIAPLIGLAWQP